MATSEQEARIQVAGQAMKTVIHEMGGKLGIAKQAMTFAERELREYDKDKVISEAISYLDISGDILDSLKAMMTGQETPANQVKLTDLKKWLCLDFTHAQRKHIHFSIPDDLVADSNITVLGIIGTNLIKNAFESGAAEQISVSAGQTDSSIYLRFEDDGKGMEEQVVEQLFTSYSSNEGEQNVRGLGMQIVKSWCDQNNIGIICSSEIGQGTCFELNIPLATN